MGAELARWQVFALEFHVLRVWRSASSRCRPALRGQLPPATGAIVRDNLLEHCREGGGVDLLALPNCDGTGGLVVVSAGDDAVWVGHDPAVVQEDIDPVLSRQQRTDVAFERKVRLARALDGLHQLRIRGMSQVADLTADGLLPLGQTFDVGVDPWVCVVSRHWFITPRANWPSLASNGRHQLRAWETYRTRES